MPRLVRRAPLSERLKAYLSPHDFLLWLSEELNDDAYEEWLESWSVPIGIGFNILFILARGASANAAQKGRNEDVFGDGGGGSGWFTWLAGFIVQLLSVICCLNAFYTFSRKRNYRIFEQPIDVALATPSAHRVPVDSSPVEFSLWRYLREIVSWNAPDSDTYPGSEREVWELSIWDPKPTCLSIFTLFSPGHLLLYFALLPPAALDPRPSVTVVTAIAFGCLLSLQLILLKTSFSRQAKDTRLMHGEVMNEYNSKFVRPLLDRPVSDVGIQTRGSSVSEKRARTREVDIYPPTTIVNRGFRASPNPYISHDTPITKPSSYTKPTSFGTPTNGSPAFFQQQPTSNARLSTGMSSRTSTEDFSSPIKPQEAIRERLPMKGDGGSMGAYTHAINPSRKAASSSHLWSSRGGMEVRGGTRSKRVTTPGGGLT